MDEKLVKALAKALDGEYELLSDSKFVLAFKDVRLTGILDADGVHWQGMWPTDTMREVPGRGALTLAASVFPKVLRDHGYKRMTLYSLPGREGVFAGIGYEPVAGAKWFTKKWRAAHEVPEGDEVMVHPVDENSRNEQYAAWKLHGGPKPDWRE